MAESRKEQFRQRRTLLPLFRSWYGRERGTLELSAHSAGPVSAAEVMKELCENLIDRDVALYITLETRWKEIIPGKLAACARTARCREGVLFLEVRHSALVRELTPSLDLFLARIAAAVGSDEIREIRLVPAGSLSRRK